MKSNISPLTTQPLPDSPFVFVTARAATLGPGIDHRGPVFLCALFMVVFLLSGCTSVTVPEGDAPSLPTLQTEKQKAEQWARILKAEHGSNKDAVNTGRKLYIDASSTFDGIIDGIKRRVSGDVRTDSGNLEADIKVGVSKSALFVDYAQSLKNGQTMSPGAVAAVVNALLPVVIENVSQFVTKQRGANLTRVLRSLDELKWQRFEEISPSAAQPSTNRVQKPK